MKKIRTLLFPAIAFLFAATTQAEPGKGHGPGHGRMSDDFRGVIHELFANHEAFTRSVEITQNGYRAKTISQDKAKAELLQKHVAQMESRLEGGMSVRHWDPAFAELREHYEELKITIENIDGGIAVKVTGKTPEAIAVAKNHAAIISGFVSKGGEQMHAEHPAVVSSTDTVAEAKPKGNGETGCQGKGKGSCGKEGCGKGKKPCCAARAGEAKEDEPKK